MAKHRIEAYVLAWHLNSNMGRVKLKLQNGEMPTLNVDGSDFAALGAILREQSVYFDDEHGIVLTELEPPDSP